MRAVAARVREEHSETAYFTDRAIDLIEDLGDTPWCTSLELHQAALALYGPRRLITPCTTTPISCRPTAR